MHLTEGLAGLIGIDHGITERKFYAIIEELFYRTDVIRNVAVAQGSRVIYVYPKQGNENVLGLDYTGHEEQWPAVQRVMKERQLVVAGPVKLVQGGMGVIGRTPIFVSDPMAPGGLRYWGLSSTVIDFDHLIRQTSLPLIEKHLDIAIRGKDGPGASGEVFYGDAALFDRRPVRLDIPLPSGSWQIAGVPANRWPVFSGVFSVIFLSGSLVSFVLAYFLYRLLVVDRQRRYEIRERRAAEGRMALLRDVAVGIGMAEGLEQALRHVLVQTCNTAGWDYAEIWWPDKEEDHLRSYPVWYSRQPGMEGFRDVSRSTVFQKGEGLPGKAWARQEAVTMNEEGLFAFARNAAVLEKGLKSGIAVPVISDEKVELVLCFFAFADQPTTSSSIPILSAVAAQIGLLIGRKKAEEEVRILNQQLERRVMQRTEELLAANGELEAFSYSVSHDLRAPLRAINGFSNLLAESNADRLDEKGKKYLYTIADATRRMGQLIDDLLMFARLNRQSIKRESVALNPLFDGMVEELRVIEGFRRITIERDDLPVVQTDPLLIRQAFFNLLSNAFKFTRKVADPHICISAEQTEDQVVVSIRDNGEGFDMKYASRLFDIFQRLHKEEDFEGTGVGLSIVQRIVQRHGGGVWFEAAEGKGATFSVLLPVQYNAAGRSQHQDGDAI